MLLTVFQWAFWVVGIGLQILLLISLSQGAGRNFPALFAYIVSLLATTLADILAVSTLGRHSSMYVSYYWLAELVRQTVLFALVVSLAVYVLPVNRRTTAMTRLMALSAAVIWTISVAACYTIKFNAWMTAVARNLSFFNGVLTLMVWFLCARRETRDIQRLMIAGGLGLQMTGEAIGQAVRQMKISEPVTTGASVFIVLTHLMCLFIWWRALELDPRTA